MTSRYHGNQIFWITTVWSLSFNDGDDDRKCFFVHFLAVVARFQILRAFVE